MSNCNPSMTKAGLLKRLNEVSFAVNDIHLFLDTHPCDEKALAFFQEVSEERNRLLKEYASSLCGTGQYSHFRGNRKEVADSLCGIMKKDYNIL